MKKNIYRPIEARIEDIITETPAIKTFVIKPEEDFSFATGQFIELSIPGVGEAPFTPSSDPSVKERIEVTIMKAGRITGMLHESKPGDRLGIRGPYGKGYPLDKFKGKEILIVGGGVGLAPLRTLLYSLFARLDNYKKVILRYGARTPNDIVYKQALAQWALIDGVDTRVTVDIGSPEWQGKVGLVTTVLEDLAMEAPNTQAIVCGPPIMMKFVTFKLIEIGIRPENLYLSMEKNMSCGLGKCGHCRIGPYFACKDGPVFTYDQVKDLKDNIWD